MSTGLELAIPRDIQPAIQDMLVVTAYRISTLCGQFAAIQEERNALLPEGVPAPNTAVTSDDIVGADKIPELPLDHAEKPPLLQDMRLGKLDRREQELRNSHSATVQKSAEDLWEMQPGLKGHTFDFIGMAAVLEVVTPYEGDGQTVLDRTGNVFTKMRWRAAILQCGMPVLGFDTVGTDQLAAFGGAVDEVAMHKGQHAAVVLDLTLKNGKEIARPLPPLLDKKDPNYLYYAGNEQGDFADNAYANGLGLADVDRAIQEARPQRF